MERKRKVREKNKSMRTNMMRIMMKMENIFGVKKAMIGIGITKKIKRLMREEILSIIQY